MPIAAPVIELSTDKSRLDRDLIHRFLHGSYWAAGIPRETVDRAIDHSFCIAAFVGGGQVAFARLITDHATFAYLADVFVLESHRGRGISKQMIQALLDHPEVQGLRRWMLATFDAQKLYAELGFAPVKHPDRFMEIHRANAYGQPTAN